MAALTLDHVSHAYSAIQAVDDLSLAVEEGALVCLVGPSGCGKTTALRIAAGLETLQQGRVLIGGQVVAEGALDVHPEDRNVGLVFQDYALFPHLSVLDNVAFGLHRQSGRVRRARALESLDLVGMAEFAPAFPHTLSGGQQQRVALARALAPKPLLMLLDEPFSGLDKQLRDQVRDQTLHILKNSGGATLMVTHDPEEAMFMADEIALMREGRLVQMGPPEELYFAPCNAFSAGFFGEINRLEGVVENQRVFTPFGQVPTSGFAEGASVEVLIRPEALRLQPIAATTADTPDAARVMASRMLGRTSLVHLSVNGKDSEGGSRDLHLHARVPGRFLPSEDERFIVHLDRSQTFVFPLVAPT